MCGYWVSSSAAILRAYTCLLKTMADTYRYVLPNFNQAQARETRNLRIHVLCIRGHTFLITMPPRLWATKTIFRGCPIKVNIFITDNGDSICLTVGSPWRLSFSLCSRTVAWSPTPPVDMLLTDESYPKVMMRAPGRYLGRRSLSHITRRPRARPCVQVL